MRGWYGCTVGFLLVHLWLQSGVALQAATKVEAGAPVLSVYVDIPEFLLRRPETSPAVVWKKSLTAGATTLEITAAQKTASLDLSPPFADWPGKIFAFVESNWGPVNFPASPSEIAPLTQGTVDFWSVVRQVTPETAGNGVLSPEQALALADGYLLLAWETWFNYDPSFTQLAARASALVAYAQSRSPEWHDKALARQGAVLTLQGEGAEMLKLTEGLKLEGVAQAWNALARFQVRELQKMVAADPNAFYRKLEILSEILNGWECARSVSEAYKLDHADQFYLWLAMDSGTIDSGRALERLQPVTSWLWENHELENWMRRTNVAFDQKVETERLKTLIADGSGGDSGQAGGKASALVVFQKIKDRHDSLGVEIKPAPGRPAWALGDPEIVRLSNGRTEAVLQRKFNFYFNNWGVRGSIEQAQFWQTLFPKSYYAPVALEMARNRYDSESPWDKLKTLSDLCPPEARSLALAWISGVYTISVIDASLATAWHAEAPADPTLTLVEAYLNKETRTSAQAPWDDYLTTLKDYPLAPLPFYRKLISRSFNSAHMEKGLAVLGEGAALRPDDYELYSLCLYNLQDLKRDWPHIMEMARQGRDRFPDREAPYVYGIRAFLAWDKPQEAINWVGNYTDTVKEPLALAVVNGELAKAYVKLQKWDVALKIVGDSDSVGSWDAMNAFIQTNFAASKAGPAFERINEMLSRYEMLPQPVLPCLEAPGSSQLVPVVGDHLSKMRRREGGILEFLETLDHLGRLGELKAEQLQPLGSAASGFLIHYVALLRRDGRFDEATAATVEQMAKLKNKNQNYLLLSLEHDRAVARNRSLTPLAEEGFLAAGEVIGPFRNWRGEAFDTVYPPETEYMPDKAYEGASGEIVRWKNWSVKGCNPFWYATPFLNDPSASWSAYYLRFEIPGGNTANTTRKLWAFFGYDASRFEIFLNGKSLVKTGKKEITQDLPLQSGNNILLVKVCGGSRSPMAALKLLP
jgi:hypothetical protein